MVTLFSLEEATASPANQQGWLVGLIQSAVEEGIALAQADCRPTPAKSRLVSRDRGPGYSTGRFCHKRNRSFKALISVTLPGSGLARWVKAKRLAKARAMDALAVTKDRRVSLRKRARAALRVAQALQEGLVKPSDVGAWTFFLGLAKSLRKMEEDREELRLTQIFEARAAEVAERAQVLAEVEASRRKRKEARLARRDHRKVVKRTSRREARLNRAETARAEQEARRVAKAARRRPTRRKGLSSKEKRRRMAEAASLRYWWADVVARQKAEQALAAAEAKAKAKAEAAAKKRKAEARKLANVYRIRGGVCRELRQVDYARLGAALVEVMS